MTLEQGHVYAIGCVIGFGYLRLTNQLTSGVGYVLVGLAVLAVMMSQNISTAITIQEARTKTLEYMMDLQRKMILPNGRLIIEEIALKDIEQLSATRVDDLLKADMYVSRVKLEPNRFYRVDIDILGGIRGVSRTNTAFHVNDVKERKVFSDSKLLKQGDDKVDDIPET